MKKIFIGITCLVVAAIAAFNVNLNAKGDNSLLTLANVEALAQNEVDGPPMTISCRYANTSNSVWSGTFMWRCQDCSYSICDNPGSTSTCTRY